MKIRCRFLFFTVKPVFFVNPQTGMIKPYVRYVSKQILGRICLDTLGMNIQKLWNIRNFRKFINVNSEKIRGTEIVIRQRWEGGRRLFDQQCSKTSMWLKRPSR